MISDITIHRDRYRVRPGPTLHHGVNPTVRAVGPFGARGGGRPGNGRIPGFMNLAREGARSRIAQPRKRLRLNLDFAMGDAPSVSSQDGTTVVDGNGTGGYVLTTQVTQSLANPNVVNTSSSNPTISVSGNTVTVGSSTTNTLFTNFSTVGGSGSGGGAGLGGVFYVDSGQTLVLNNVSFSSNTTSGGTGGVGTLGGSMNGLVSSSAAAAGGNGADSPSGYGNVNSGNGGNGFQGWNGANASSGVGGQGGSGGNGSNGIPITADTVYSTLVTAHDLATGINDVVEGSDFTAMAATFAALGAAAAVEVNVGGPTTVGLAPEFEVLATEFGEMAADEATQNATDLALLAADTAYNTALLITSYELGASGAGGGGGNGGNGGNGGASANGGIPGGSYLAGGAGSGGSAGFGGGVGSSGTTDNGDGTYGSGGGGGSGYGGALFVSSGGALTITGNALFQDNATLAGSSANGGAAGDSTGSDLFMQKGSTVTLSPGVGNTIAFLGTIADDSASSIANASYAAGNGASIVITGGGTVQFENANTYSGTTYINGATLEADNGTGINTASHVAFDGTGGINNSLSTLDAGVWLTGGNLTRRVGTLDTQISWGGSGGFAATADGLTLNFGSINGGLGQALTWGSGSFVPVGSTLIFGSDAIDATGIVTLKNNINLNGNQGQIAVYANAAGTDYANIAGRITNGTLLVGDTGYSGTLYLTGQNALSGLTVQNGTVSTLLGNTVGTLMDATNGGYLTITGGAVILGGAEKLTSVNLSSDTALTAYGALTTSDITNAGTIVAKSTLNAGNITNSGTMALGADASTGAITNSGGIGVAGTLNTGGATIANTLDGVLQVDGDLHAGTLSNDGVMAVAGTATTGDVTNTGLLAVNGDASTGAITNALGAELSVVGALGAGWATVTNAGVIRVGGDATTGAVTNSGFMRVSGATASDDIANSGMLILTGAAQIGALNNSGTALLGGVTSAGAITNSGLLIQSAAMTSSADVANTSSGQWNLGADLTALGTVTNDGALVVTNSGNTITTTGFAGAGTGVVGLGGVDGTAANTLTILQSGNSAYVGSFVGAGALVKDGAGTLNLTGASSFTGGLTIAAGTLDTTGGGTLADTLAITVDQGATLIMGTADLVGSIANAGTLTTTAEVDLTTLANTGSASIGKLLAASGNVSNAVSASFDLASTATAQIAGDLNNAGTMTSSGILTVAGQTTNNGTLTLASGSGTTLAKLTNAGTLSAQGNLTVTGAVNNTGSMTLAAGSTPQFGSLTNAGQITASDKLVVAGSLTQNSGTLTANGGLATGTLSGAGGTIALAGSTWTLDQTTDGTYSGSVTGGGTVDKYGAGTLTLDGATGNFSPRNLHVLAGGGGGGGNVSVNTFAPSVLNIYAGGVTVATAGLLDQMLSVLVDTAGTLTLQADQTIHDLTGTGTLNIGTANLTLAAGGDFDGTINGTGQIEVSTGNLTVNHAIADTGGAFTVNSASSVTVGASGSIAATDINVNGGVLNLLGSAQATTTTLSNGATLHLGNGVDLSQNDSIAGSLTSGITSVTGGSSITGNGTISGAVNVGGASTGIIAPGNSPGVLVFDTLNFGDNAVAAMQVDGAAGAGLTGGNDQIAVTRMLTLSGTSALTITKSVSNDFSLALGQAVRLFKFDEGNISGHFGSVTMTGYSGSAILNLATGSLIGLGSYTPASFVAAISTTPNQAAITSALMVNDAGGVPQYYGGNLMGYVTGALAANPASVGAVFARWSPEAYAGITDQMKYSVLDNLPELGGYDHLAPGRTSAIGGWNHAGIDGANWSGYARNQFRDDALNLGVARQFGFGQVTVSYAHSDGNVRGANISDRTMGDQVGLGISVPLAFDQALRLTGRFVYGGYTSNGARSTNSGLASFSGVKSRIYTYGSGFEYLKQAGHVRVDATAEVLGMHARMDGFGEYAGGSASADTLDLMSVRQMTRDAYVGRLAATVGYTVSPVVEIHANGTYDHEFGNPLTDITARVSVEDTSFTVTNPGLSRDRFTAGGGVKLNASDRLQFNLDGGAGVDASYRVSASVRSASDRKKREDGWRWKSSARSIQYNFI